MTAMGKYGMTHASGRGAKVNRVEVANIIATKAGEILLDLPRMQFEKALWLRPDHDGKRDQIIQFDVDPATSVVEFAKFSQSTS